MLAAGSLIAAGGLAAGEAPASAASPQLNLKILLIAEGPNDPTTGAWQAALTRQVCGDYQEEFRILRPDGTLRWISDRAFPIKDESGHVYRIAGVARDITELKLA